MSELFLGVIAIAVLVMAVLQVTAVVFAVRAAQRVGEAVSRFEADVKPIMNNLRSLSSDAARTANIAAAQAQHAEHVIADLTGRLSDAVSAVEASVIAPARDAYAVVQGLLAAFSTLRQAPAQPRSVPSEEEDSLFIG